MGPDGTISAQGSVSYVLSQNTELADELKAEEETMQREAHEHHIESEDPQDIATRSEATSGKLVLAEELEEGRVSQAACESEPAFLRYVIDA